MEKILLACKIIQKGGLGQALLSVMFEKRVPGFFTDRGRQNFQLPAGAAFAAWKGQYKSENPVDKART